MVLTDSDVLNPLYHDDDGQKNFPYLISYLGQMEKYCKSLSSRS